MYNPVILQQLAPHIKSARIALGLSQVILAQRAAVSRTTLSRLEGGYVIVGSLSALGVLGSRPITSIRCLPAYRLCQRAGSIA